MPTIRIVSDWHRRRALDAVAAAPLGHIVSVREPTRTLDQSAKMWAMLGDVSKARVEGYTKATPKIWKMRFMHGLGHEVQFDTGLDGKPYPIGLSSSELTVRQMADLITFIEAWCAQNGVALSEPNSPK